MTRIIRDNGDSLTMAALCIDWAIRRCNQRGCTKRPNTIIAGAEGAGGAFGLCEEHYQQGNVPGGTHYDLVRDDFDAFAKR